MTPLEFIGTLSMGALLVVVVAVVWLRAEGFLLSGEVRVSPSVVPRVRDEAKAHELQATGQARAEYARKVHHGNRTHDARERTDEDE